MITQLFIMLNTAYLSFTYANEFTPSSDLTTLLFDPNIIKEEAKGDFNPPKFLNAVEHVLNTWDEGKTEIS